ncbi:hypothetical protein DEO72_LG3g197 [Vigna unguiculata]|uniref:Uncharacterized protein n=1 Tax=Vigna unguiculata TaxID=3917 RepID=A0A4D6LAS8_VIGUN|nr:hypothetical protein DEO72_LG3g197 [Vigna unguiculata]
MAVGGSRGGLAWWWPDARRDGGGRRLAWWSRVVGSPEVVERRGDSDDGIATVAVAAREAVAVAARSSRCWSGRNLKRVAGICREKWRSSWRARGRKGFCF